MLTSRRSDLGGGGSGVPPVPVLPPSFAPPEPVVPLVPSPPEPFTDPPEPSPPVPELPPVSPLLLPAWLPPACSTVSPQLASHPMPKRRPPPSRLGSTSRSRSDCKVNERDIAVGSF